MAPAARPILTELAPRLAPAASLAAALSDGQVRIDTAVVTPFPDAPGVPVSVADGGDLVWVGAGPGGGPRVRAYTHDGAPAGLDFFAFEPSFRGGVKVAAAGGLGYVAPGPGGAPVVKTFDGPTLIQSIYVGDPASREGVADLAAYAAPNDVPVTTGNPTGTGTVFVDFEDFYPRPFQAEVLRQLAEIYEPVGWLRFTNRRPAGVLAGEYGTMLVSSAPYAGDVKSAAGYQADDWLTAGPSLSFRNPYAQRTNYARGSSSAAELARTIGHELGHALGLGHVPDPRNLMAERTSAGKSELTAEQVARLAAAEPRWLGRDPAAP